MNESLEEFETNQGSDDDEPERTQSAIFNTMVSKFSFVQRQSRKKILVGCLLALCVANMMMDNVYAFIPSFVEDRNKSKTED